MIIQDTTSEDHRIKSIYEKIIEVQYRWGVGFIQRMEIRSKIKVYVKTFHG